MTAALEISRLQAWYGESHILHDVNLTVNTGEVVTLLGRNGAGRTTTLRAILGLTGSRTGSIRINGQEANPRDGIAITGEEALTVEAIEDCELVMVDAR